MTIAIRSFHLHKLHGTPINVEASHKKNQGPVKLHVANVDKGSDDELRALFEDYGGLFIQSVPMRVTGRYSVVDYYEKYRARPYAISPYEEHRAIPPPPPPPPSSVVRDRLMSSALDPYEHRPLPAPPPPCPSSYYARDRSPIRGAPSTP
ncbi:hypothetical protein GOODEAATRI_026587 [Goodea atripinnis]|uniref:RRM domain-containing protein n=1 Tax=Goodea atripinnis TaxID=208336 RepID=A0ABV0PRY0_9TELE